MPVRKKGEPLDFSESDLYSSPYPGTAIGKVDHLLERSSLFSETADENATKSDECLFEEVCLMLYQNPAVDATEVEVEVREGVVTLKGFVHSRYMSWVAETSIENVEGIKDIVNLLEVKQLRQ